MSPEPAHWPKPNDPTHFVLRYWIDRGEELTAAVIESLARDAAAEAEGGSVHDFIVALRGVQPHMMEDWMEGFNVALDALTMMLPPEDTNVVLHFGSGGVREDQTPAADVEKGKR